MNNIKIILTVSFAVGYFCILNNPKFIKTFKIKINDEHIIYYGIIYILLVYSTWMIINKIMPDEQVEHLSGYAEMAHKLRRDMEADLKSTLEQASSVDGEDDAEACKQAEEDLMNQFKSNSDMEDIIKGMKAHPYKWKICTKEDRKKCHKMDMSKFVLKESVPKCDYVLPQQYNLYKPRKGYTPGDPAEDPTLDTIINKDNYIMFFVGFVILLAIYIAVLMLKSIF